MNNEKEIYEALLACKNGGSDRLSAVLYVCKTLKMYTYIHDVEIISRMVAPVDHWPDPVDVPLSILLEFERG